MACSCKSGTRTALQLIEKYQVAPETYTFDFAPIEPFQWQEGDSSALVVKIPGINLEDSRKLSFASLPNEHVVRFTTRIRKDCSLYKEHLLQLAEGDFVEITMPEGDFSLIREGRPALLLSNGVGIAAMRALVMAFHDNGSDVDRLTQINVDAGGSIYKEELTEIMDENKSFSSQYLNHREELYPAIDDATRDLMFATGRMPYFYVVGSDAFILDVRQYLISSGFTEMDIITDEQGCNCGGSKINEVKALGKVTLGRSLNLRKVIA